MYRFGVKFLTKSKKLTFSCFASIFFAVLAIVVIYNFYFISQRSYMENIKDTFGDCDYLVSDADYQDFPENLIENIKDTKGIKKVSYGHWAYTNVENHLVYTVGVKDSDMNKSRYRYVSDVTENSVIVNWKLAEDLQLDIGDKVTMEGMELEVSEILADDNFSLSNLYMVIVSMDNLCKSQGLDIVPNYALVKKEKKEGLNEVKERLQSLGENLDITAVEELDDYQKIMKGFRGFMTILVVIIVGVAGLLISSVFVSYLKKYQGDTIVLKTIGARKGHILQIFFTSAMILSTIGCGLGYLVAMVGGRGVFLLFASELELSREVIQMNVGISFCITIGIWIAINVFLLFTAWRYAKKLPLQMKPEKTRETKIRRWILFYTTKKDIFISLRLLIPWIRENIFFLFTIAAITMFTFVSSAFMHDIEQNSLAYYRNLYLSEVMIENDETMSYQEITDIQEKLESQQKNTFFVAEMLEWEDIICVGIPNKKSKNWWDGTLRLGISQMDRLYEANVIKVKKENYQDCVILRRDVADHYGLKVGDTYTLEYFDKMENVEWVEEYENQEKHTKDLEVVGIMESTIGSQIVVDITLPLFDFSTLEDFSVTFFMSETDKQTESLLQSLRWEIPTLRWQNYSDVEKQNSRIMRERYIMIRAVLYSLTLLGGIGWLNSARTMLRDKREIYLTLRRIGISDKRVQKIIWKQILCYLMFGIVLGLLFGIVAEWFLYFYYLEEEFPRVFISPVFGILVYMLALAATLWRFVKDIANLERIRV